MSIQLSISLLASNRKETLRKCLDSITPLLREIPSELIVVFTGQDTEVKKIAEEYTDQVIPFTWCNDFSAARNVGLEKAKGEWFLYIDDDEWFEDVEEICAFFKSGEYRQYHSAEYIIRNYLDITGTRFIDFSALRMTRRTEETRFVYTIHEKLQPAEEPVKYLKSFVHHYGYVKKQKEGNKSERNIPPLLKESEKSPENKVLYMQIAQEYGSIKDYQEAERYCRKGLEVMRAGGPKEPLDDWLPAHYALYIFSQEDWKRTLQETEYILKEDSPTELVQGYLHSLRVKAAEKLKAHDICLESAGAFHEAAEYLRNHPEICAGQAVGDISYITIEKSKLAVYSYSLHAAHELQEQTAVRNILGWILQERERTGKNDFYAVLDGWKRENEDEEKKIMEYFRDLESEDVYVTLQKALYAELKGNREEAENGFHTCVSQKNPYLRYELAYMGIRNEFEMSALIEQIDLQVWTEYAEAMAKDIGNEEQETFFEKAKKTLVVYPLYYAVMERFFLEKKLQLGMLDGEELCKVAEQYAKSVVGYYRSLYKEELFREPMWFCLPVECQFSMLLVDAMESAKRREFKEYAEFTRRAAYIYPQMSHVLKKLTGYMQKQIDAPPVVANPEFAVLGQQVKASVRQMIEKKQYREAMAIIGQLENLLPNDLEVLRMKQRILREE